MTWRAIWIGWPMLLTGLRDSRHARRLIGGDDETTRQALALAKPSGADSEQESAREAGAVPPANRNTSGAASLVPGVVEHAEGGGQADQQEPPRPPGPKSWSKARGLNPFSIRANNERRPLR